MCSNQPGLGQADKMVRFEEDCSHESIKRVQSKENRDLRNIKDDAIEGGLSTS